MNLPVQHLSDEAVAAFADGMLATPAYNRAARHIGLCPECAVAVDEQRAAVSALRAAPAPALPIGLLERLRAVPVTTTLTPSAMALAPDGSAVFPAFGTAIASISRPERHEFHVPVAGSHHGLPHLGRRTQQLALVAVAAAMMTVGVAASATTGSASPAPSRLVPGNSEPIQSAGFSSQTGGAQLVNAINAGSTRRH